MTTKRTSKALRSIKSERDHQAAKWGDASHEFGEPRPSDYGLFTAGTYKAQTARRFKANEGTWFDILVEEVAEAIEQTNNPYAMRMELVQVAAVAVAMIEQIDRELDAIEF